MSPCPMRRTRGSRQQPICDISQRSPPLCDTPLGHLCLARLLNTKARRYTTSISPLFFKQMLLLLIKYGKNCTMQMAYISHLFLLCPCRVIQAEASKHAH